MSIDKSSTRLLSRARSLSESIESPHQRLHWEVEDIDAIGEAASMLYDKGLSSIEEPELRLDWDIQFCKIFASLAYWRAEFSLSWSCSERLIKLLRPLPDRADELAFALVRAGLAASHYARFDAIRIKNRHIAFDRAEALFAEALPHSSRSSAATISGMPIAAHIFYEASRHWHLAELPDPALYSMNKAYELDPEACAEASLMKTAPKFWRDQFITTSWLTISQRS